MTAPASVRSGAVETACLLGNGVSIAYNPDLTVTALTRDLLVRFAAAGASAPDRALRLFASHVSSGVGSDFEALLGPLASVADALTFLSDVGPLARNGPHEVERALTTVSTFLGATYRAGVAITLEHIAQRTIGGNFWLS